VSRNLRRALIALVVLGAVALGMAQQGEPAGGGATRLPDTQLGLSKTSVRDVPVSDAYEYRDSSPGDSERIPQELHGAPPLVPHSVDGLLPITRESNACVTCHGTPGPASETPPPAPPSHFVDLRHAPGVMRTEVAGGRWVCTSCHVPQTNAPALPGSVSERPSPR
jgi:nitrate reductase (cytochrome), electron transfer subunit